MESVEELFKLKIASKRQTTIPQRMLAALGIREGDEIHVLVNGGHIVQADACKVMATSLFNDEINNLIERRKQELAARRQRNVVTPKHKGKRQIRDGGTRVVA